MREWLLGTRTVVLTDHLNLISSLRAPTNPLVRRWMLGLHDFDLVIQHIEGRLNLLPDALSRVPYTTSEVVELLPTEHAGPLPHVAAIMTRARASAAAATDIAPAQPAAVDEDVSDEEEEEEIPADDLAIAITDLHEDLRAQSLKVHARLAGESEGQHAVRRRAALLRGAEWNVDKEKYVVKQGARTLVVVPRSDDTLELRLTLVAMAHVLLGGHQGANRTYLRIRAAGFVWRDMRKDVHTYATHCIPCQRHGAAPLPSGTTHFLESDALLQRVHCDKVGPIRESHGFRYIIVFVDSFSKYVWARPCATITAEETAELLAEYVSYNGLMTELVTDHGSDFSSDLVKRACGALGIRDRRTTVRHSQANGEVECYNRWVIASLRRLIEEHDHHEWTRWLPIAVSALNASRCAAHGFSPFEVWHGRKYRGPIEVLGRYATDEEEDTAIDEDADFVDALVARVKMVHEEVRRKLDETLQRYRRARKRCEAAARTLTYRDGDLVWVYFSARSHKLSAMWRGPYRVVGNGYREVLYDVRHPLSGVVSCVHVSRIKPVYQPLLRGELTTKDIMVEASDGEYMVERVIGHEIVDGATWLTIHWKGFEEEDTSVEPLEELVHLPIVKAYCRRQGLEMPPALW